MKRGLQPTLWRTCRVLANCRRLKAIELLIRHEVRGMAVVDIARHMNWTVSVASQELRRLQSRGLLQCRRAGRRTWYRFAPDQSLADAVRLAPVLRSGFLVHRGAFVEECYRLATGFTHPRRIKIVQALAMARLPFEGIRARTLISRQALSRHLAKLEQRGFIQHGKDAYWLSSPSSPMGRTLLALALSR